MWQRLVVCVSLRSGRALISTATDLLYLPGPPFFCSLVDCLSVDRVIPSVGLCQMHSPRGVKDRYADDPIKAMELTRPRAKTILTRLC